MSGMIPDEKDEKQSALADEFQALCESVQDQIKAKILEAHKALGEAVAIAEKHGVPFRASISPLSNSYVPRSFKKSKFRQLETDEIEEISGAYGEYMRELFDYGGWLHSAVC